MGEGTHTVKSAGKKSKYPLIIAGTAVTLLATGVLVQVLRPTDAYPDTPTAKGAPAAATTKAPTKRYLARVGTQYIDYDTVAEECVKQNGEQVLDALISRMIIQQACDAQGVEVTATEVNEEIVRTAKKFGLAVDQYLQMLQAERNVSPAQYRQDIVWPMLALKKLAGEQVKITETDMKMAFERNYGPRVKARAIVLDNLRRATDVWEKAQKNPADFGRLAKEFSIDPNSRALEGAVPPIRRYGGSPEVEDKAFKLKTGEISGVIQVGMGDGGASHYVILLCEGRTEPVTTDRKEVDNILRQELQEEKVQESVHKVFAKLKSDARVDNFLTGVSTGGERKAAPGTSQTSSPIQQVGGTVPQGAANRGAPGGNNVPTTNGAAKTGTSALPPRQPATQPSAISPAKKPTSR